MLDPSDDKCKYSTWRWLNKDTGEIRPYNCGSWSCPDHRASTAYHWACRVAESTPDRMITLTRLPDTKERARIAFTNLIRDIRAEGIRFEYARFLEVGSKTGMRHYHMAQRGDFVPKHFLSARAEANGLGKITYIEKCYGEGPAFYLAKYITKDSAPAGWRKVASSRNFFRKSPEVPADLRTSWVLVRGD